MYKDWVPFYTTTQWRQAEVGLGLSLIAEDFSREIISFKKNYLHDFPVIQKFWYSHHLSHHHIM